MKRTLILAAALALLAGIAATTGLIPRPMPALAAEADAEMTPYEGEMIELADGEGNPVAALRVTGYLSEKPRGIAVAYALTNTGSLALTRVTFTVDCRDAGGRSLTESPIEVAYGMAADPLAPGENRAISRRQWFDGAGAAVDFTVAPVLAETELDLAPWTEPRPGNLLLDFCNDPSFSAHFENLDANPPVTMHVRVDQRVDEDITDADVILAQIESLRNMRVGGESDIRVTDSGIAYWFTMADGAEWGVSFEAPGLFCWHNKVYEVLPD